MKLFYRIIINWLISHCHHNQRFWKNSKFCNSTTEQSESFSIDKISTGKTTPNNVSATYLTHQFVHEHQNLDVVNGDLVNLIAAYRREARFHQPKCSVERFEKCFFHSQVTAHSEYLNAVIVDLRRSEETDWTACETRWSLPATTTRTAII